jgi:hypothetical protein
MDSALRIVPVKEHAKRTSHLNREVFATEFPRVLVVAPSFSGKTALVGSLLRNPAFGMRKEYMNGANVFLHSSTADLADPQLHGSGILPENVRDRYSPADVEELFAEQKSHIHALGARAKAICLLLDDVVTEVSSAKDDPLTRAFTKGRHHNCSVWLLSQGYMFVPRGCRLNASDLVVFRCNPTEIERLAKEQSGVTPERFRQIYEHAVREPFSFLHISCASPLERRFRVRFDGPFIEP